MVGDNGELTKHLIFVAPHYQQSRAITWGNLQVTLTLGDGELS